MHGNERGRKKKTLTVKLAYYEKTVGFSLLCSCFLKALKCPNTPQIHANWGKSKNEDEMIENFSMSQFTPNQGELGQHRFFQKNSKPRFHSKLLHLTS